MARSTKEYVCATIGIAVGGLCFYLTNSTTKEWMDPIVSSCTEGNWTSVEERLEMNESLVPYNPTLGGGFVCLITQFLHALAVNYPSGLLTWGGVMLVSLPFLIICAVEAGRVGTVGPVRYSLITTLLSQFVGACVIMPALWIPSYVLGNGIKGGAFHRDRPMAGVVTSLPVAVISIGIFALNPSTVAWTNCAGILGGPIMALLPLIYYLSPTPTNIRDMKMNSEAAKANYVRAFRYMGILSFVGWIVLVYHGGTAYYGSSTNAQERQLVKDLWTEAHPAVKFMTIDTTGFFIATLLYTYLQGVDMAIRALLLTPLVGPGAALCYVLARKEPMYVIPKEKQ